MDIVVNTQRLRIRPVQDNYSEIQAYGRINGLPGTHQDWRGEWWEWKLRGAHLLLIMLRDPSVPASGAPIVGGRAVVGFIKIINPVQNEVSFRTHEYHERRGYMKEALRGVIPAFFRQRPTDQLFVETRRDNGPVISIMRGFRLEEQYGNWSDVGSVFWQFGSGAWRWGNGY